MSSRCPLCGEMDYSDMGDMPCLCRRAWPAGVELEQTVEEYCAAHDHAYYGDDGPPPHGVGRCYCGVRSYPPGGPVEGATLGRMDEGLTGVMRAPEDDLWCFHPQATSRRLSGEPPSILRECPDCPARAVVVDDGSGAALDPQMLPWKWQADD